MTYINYSEQESNKSNLRIGRTDILKTFNPESLIREIIDLKLDICRLKVDISNPEIFQLLEQINFPIANHSFLIEQKIDLESIENDFNFDKDIEIIEYDLSKKNELLQIIKKIQDSDIFNIYYKNEIIEKLIPNNILNEVIAEYQTTFDSNIDKNKYCFLAYKDKTLIGFCTLGLNDTFGEGILVGIIPEFRSNDLFKNLVKIQIKKSKELGRKYYMVKTIAFNSRSLNTTIKQGLKVNRTILNLNIMPLLNYKCNNLMILANAHNFLNILSEIIKNLFDVDTQIINYKTKKIAKENSNYNIRIFKDLSLITFNDEQSNCYGFINLG